MCSITLRDENIREEKLPLFSNKSTNLTFPVDSGIGFHSTELLCTLITEPGAYCHFSPDGESSLPFGPAIAFS